MGLMGTLVTTGWLNGTGMKHEAGLRLGRVSPFSSAFWEPFPFASFIWELLANGNDIFF